MRAFTTLLLPALASLVLAEPARVYIFGDFENRATTPHHPTLSPEVARLIIAQRLDVSSYHSLEHIDETALDQINTFGKRKPALFSESAPGKSSQLVVLVNDVSSKTRSIVETAMGDIKPDFAVSDPPSLRANKQLAWDIEEQRVAVLGSSKDGGIINFDISQARDDTQAAKVLTDVIRSHKEVYSTLLVILFPPAAERSQYIANPYGTYELPSTLSRRQMQAEEIISETSTSNVVVPGAAYSPAESTATGLPLPKVVPMCYTSMDACTKSTNNCSGHGECYKKYSSSDRDSTAGDCFACKCKATVDKSKNGTSVTHWGGGACSKVDVSSPFWLIAGFTVLLVSLVAWSIGMLFSIGEEKLPGVIGAGVSGAKPR